MEKNIKETIELVSNSFPSLYSKEDVIKVLTDLNERMQEEPSKLLIVRDVLLDAFKEAYSSKSNKFEDAFAKESIEFSLGWDNKIEVDRISVDEDFLIDLAIETLEESLDNLNILAEED